MNWATEHVVLAGIQHLARRRLAEAGAPASAAISSTCSPRWWTPTCRPPWRASSTPRSDLPPSVRFVGPILAPPSTSFEPPRWWAELEDTRPVVHVTQGTLDNVDLGRLLLLTTRRLAGWDAPAVATTWGARPGAAAA